MRLSMKRYKTDNLTRVLWDKMQTQVLQAMEGRSTLLPSWAAVGPRA